MLEFIKIESSQVVPCCVYWRRFVLLAEAEEAVEVAAGADGAEAEITSVVLFDIQEGGVLKVCGLRT